MTIEIRNQTSNDITDARVWYDGGGYDKETYLQQVTVKAGVTSTLHLKLMSKWHMTISDVPDQLPIVLKDKAGRELARVSGSVDHAWFTKALVEPFDASQFDLSKFNVLLFGPSGSGKTSFYNSLRAMLQPNTSAEALRAAEPVSGGGAHCTRNVRLLEIPELPFNIIDTWGLTPEQYKKAELTALMRGQLPAGWSMDDAIPSTRADADVRGQRFELTDVPASPTTWI